MIKLAKKNHIIMLKTFYNSCGYIEETPDNICKNKLLSDLESLKLTNKHCGTKTIIVGSFQDKIVLPSIINDNFSNAGNTMIKYIDSIGHSLGFDRPDIVLNIIQQANK